MSKTPPASRTAPRRITCRGEEWIVREGARAVTAAADETVIAWDLEGRPYAGQLGGLSWRRGLDGRWREMRRGLEGPPANLLDESASGRVRAALRERAARLLEATGFGASSRHALEHAAAHDAARDFALGERYRTIYGGVPVLPPDRHLALVVQARTGCAWGRCRFCTLYAGRLSSPREPEEFTRHLDEIAAWLGAGASLRAPLFLADADALAAPVPLVETWLAAARDRFPGRTAGGFVDLCTGSARGASDWARLAGAGLERVYVGLETGSAELRRRAAKPGSPELLRPLLDALARAGLGLGLIVLGGLGAPRYADEHIRATKALLDSLPLRREDLVLVSPLELPEGVQPIEGAGAAPSPEATRAESARLYAALRHILAPRGVRVAPYDLAGFIC